MVNLFLATTGSHLHLFRIDLAVDARMDDQLWILVEVGQPLEVAALIGGQRRVRVAGKHAVLLGAEPLQLGGAHAHMNGNGRGASSIPTSFKSSPAICYWRAHSQWRSVARRSPRPTRTNPVTASMLRRTRSRRSTSPTRATASA